jgi:hypothetical protein
VVSGASSVGGVAMTSRSAPLDGLYRPYPEPRTGCSGFGSPPSDTMSDRANIRRSARDASCAHITLCDRSCSIVLSVFACRGLQTIAAGVLRPCAMRGGGWRRGKGAGAPGLRWGPKPLMRPLAPGGMPELEVGIVITVLTVEAALHDTCALFGERTGRGDITPAERDLLHVDDLAGEAALTRPPGPGGSGAAGTAGRHERHPVAAAA